MVLDLVVCKERRVEVSVFSATLHFLVTLTQTAREPVGEKSRPDVPAGDDLQREKVHLLEFILGKDGHAVVLSSREEQVDVSFLT